MLVDGRAIAEEMKEALKRDLLSFERKPSLGVIVATDDMATRKFVERKHQFGESIGIAVDVHELDTSSTTEELVRAVHARTQEHDGVVVQLPLPSGADVDAVRNAIPAEKDVDAISDAAVEEVVSGNAQVLPPVVGAIAEIVKRHGVEISGKRVAVVGSGRLVGKPSAAWFRAQGAEVTTLDHASDNLEDVTRSADIVVLGAGSPGLLTPDMVHKGVVIFDAGTSEAKGKLAGDADPACAGKASLFTPVPGGIGPITVAMIFKNVLTLSRKS